MKECEALVLLEAMSWTRGCTLWGYEHVIFEYDFQVVIKAVEYCAGDNTEFGVILNSYRHLLQSQPFFKIQFVKRNMNVVAMLWKGSRSSLPTLLWEWLLLHCYLSL